MFFELKKSCIGGLKVPNDAWNGQNRSEDAYGPASFGLHAGGQLHTIKNVNEYYFQLKCSLHLKKTRERLDKNH